MNNFYVFVDFFLLQSIVTVRIYVYIYYSRNWEANKEEKATTTTKILKITAKPN